LKVAGYVLILIGFLLIFFSFSALPLSTYQTTTTTSINGYPEAMVCSTPYVPCQPLVQPLCILNQQDTTTIGSVYVNNCIVSATLQPDGKLQLLATFGFNLYNVCNVDWSKVNYAIYWINGSSSISSINLATLTFPSISSAVYVVQANGKQVVTFMPVSITIQYNGKPIATVNLYGLLTTSSTSSTIIGNPASYQTCSQTSASTTSQQTTTSTTSTQSTTQFSQTQTQIITTTISPSGTSQPPQPIQAQNMPNFFFLLLGLILIGAGFWVGRRDGK
jgi:hypothetical protein